jgi:hypothetical protein
MFYSSFEITYIILFLKVDSMFKPVSHFIYPITFLNLIFMYLFIWITQIYIWIIYLSAINLIIIMHISCNEKKLV